MLPMVDDRRRGAASSSRTEIHAARASAAWRSAWRTTSTGAAPVHGQARRRQRADHLLRPDRDRRRGRERRRDRRRSTASTACGSAISTCRRRSASRASSSTRTSSTRSTRIARLPQARQGASGGSCPTSPPASTTCGKGFDFICYSGDVWALPGGGARRASTPSGPAPGRPPAERAGEGLSHGEVPRRAERRFQESRRHARPIRASTSRRSTDAGGRGRLRRCGRRRHAGRRPRGLRRADPARARGSTPRSVPADGRLAVVARFGVGYDSVDVAACTEAGIALVITPDGVRRPVAVSILTFMLALTRSC